MLCCGEYFNEEIHVSFTVLRGVELLPNQLAHEKLQKPTSSNLIFFRSIGNECRFGRRVRCPVFINISVILKTAYFHYVMREGIGSD